MRGIFSIYVLLVTLLGCIKADATLVGPKSAIDTTQRIASIPGISVLTTGELLRKAEVDQLHKIEVATFDKTGQSVHPDIQKFENEWFGAKYWLVFTPYYLSDARIENPSLAVSDDGKIWRIRSDIRTPLVNTPYLTGHNSDTEFAYDKERNCLYVTWREVDPVLYLNILNKIESCNGKDWGNFGKILAMPSHTAISQSIADSPDGKKRMIYVNAGVGGGCGSTATKVMLRGSLGTKGDSLLKFGAEEETDLSQPGYAIWHIKWRYVPEKREYWALYAAYPAVFGTTCVINNFFFAKSTNGKNWTSYRIPIIDRKDPRYGLLGLYRGTFLYDEVSDELNITVSAYKAGEGWFEYNQTFKYERLMHALNSSLFSPPTLGRVMIDQDELLKARSVSIEDVVR